MTDVIKRNNVTITGNGEITLVFAHGFGCDQNSWRYIKSAFTNNYRTVLFDYVGAGKSDNSYYDASKYSTLDGYANDLIEICDTMELKDAVLIAHSVSCMIGVIASIKRPMLFKKMVFIGPSPCYINGENYIGGFDRDIIDTLMEVMDEDYISWARSIAPDIMSKNNSNELGKELADSFCSVEPEIAKQFAKVTFYSDNRNDLPLISIPTLTIQCTKDTIAPMEVGKYIYANTKHNTLTIMESYGHCPHMSKPDATVAAIKTFI